MLPSPLPPDFIPFNKPHLVGPELEYIRQAVAAGKLSGNGEFTQRCQQFFEQRYGIHKALLTTSGTDALEMAALLLDIKPGDEVIVPSYTFTSTANAFVLRGARIVFVDSGPEHPNLDVAQVAARITSRTRAIVPVHYGGQAADNFTELLALARQHHLWVVEDAAQAIEARYRGQALGTLGHLAAFSFHETKNVSAGEGGLLAINDPTLAARAEILWEKGTNRAAFFRGEAARYEWVDVGSSFLPSELNAAYLWAQLEAIDLIQQRRQQLWQTYATALAPLVTAGQVRVLPTQTDSAPNWHLFGMLCRHEAERDELLAYLRHRHILAVFHYLPLHRSPYYVSRHGNAEPLPHAERFGQTLVRLPLFQDLQPDQQQRVIDAINEFYTTR
ncbi:dTDP-4-amino-4,6-dideoxygalactose transaminase [Hymenobacter weizhouensis]|uniref:dTDP-4-amino-4,6-dideoxygalactose transaminase n=1 Tax=Hymenobacter sp. YIM 151500-1 TaxID=2987689 RepID=UPI002227C3E1|nr:dTDP-4-amino-4,6-dideoxygalactose transaminase [Hymenobacter sp. YIM 151500-1]UYZ61356.1 dTDP-4-amino-4,6-dideoxygalactose transaminase [Hymenobacter sp. YIM 151500-1]